MHEGQAYRVEALDLTRHVAQLRAVNVDYYTEPRRETLVQLLDTLGAAQAKGSTKAYGEITVTTQVTGFRTVKWHTHQRLSEGDVSLPPTELQTTRLLAGPNAGNG